MSVDKYHPKPGFPSRKSAESYWYDSCPGRNDRARFVKDGNRWHIEANTGGFNPMWRRWNASEYVHPE